MSEPVTPTVGPNKGSLAVYLIDPDGHRVELVETPRNLDGTLRSTQRLVEPERQNAWHDEGAPEAEPWGVAGTVSEPQAAT